MSKRFVLPLLMMWVISSSSAVHADEAEVAADAISIAGEVLTVEPVRGLHAVREVELDFRASGNGRLWKVKCSRANKLIGACVALEPGAKIQVAGEVIDISIQEGVVVPTLLASSISRMTAATDAASWGVPATCQSGDTVCSCCRSALIDFFVCESGCGPWQFGGQSCRDWCFGIYEGRRAGCHAPSGCWEYGY